jgi:hypothetical protein
MLLTQNSEGDWVLLSYSKTDQRLQLREELREFFDTWMSGIETEEQWVAWKSFRREAFSAILQSLREKTAIALWISEGRFSRFEAGMSIGQEPLLIRFSRPEILSSALRTTPR